MVAVVRWSRYGRLGRMGEDRADRRACVGRVWPRGLRGAEAGGARGVLSSATALAAGRHWVAEAEGWKDLGERRREYVLRRLGTEGEGEFQPGRAYIRGHHCGCTSAPYEQAISGKEGALCAGPCYSSGGPALPAVPAVPAQPGCRHACLAASTAAPSLCVPIARGLRALRRAHCCGLLPPAPLLPSPCRRRCAVSPFDPSGGPATRQPARTGVQDRRKVS